jgi:hypothetical protein
MKKTADDIAAVTFINGRITIHKRIPAFAGFVAGDDFRLFRQGNL